jgi:hypothetical protein
MAMKFNFLKNTFLVFSASVLLSCSGIKNKEYVVKNPYDSDIADKAVVIQLDDLKRYVTVQEGKVVAVKDADGKYLPSQCDDLNGDGNWDELAFLIDLKANEKREVTFETVASSELPQFPKRTNIRFGEKKKPYNEIVLGTRLKTSDSPSSSAAFQMEGPAWENDIIGFRNYFDARNGMDIFGKRVSEMALDSVGLPGKPTYHALADWGMDVLKVGNSLGAGAIGIQIGDSLYRIGPSGKGRYRFISEGPVRAMLQLKFLDVKIKDRKYEVRHLISIYAGDHFYRSKVTVTGLKGDEKLITGIVDHDTKMVNGSFEGYDYFYALGPQAFLHEYLGMAILADKKVVAGSFEAPEEGAGITKTHVVSMNISDNKPVEFAFLAAWEYQDEKIRDSSYFEDLIKRSILRLN